MDNKTITFISSRGRGITPDLALVKDYFAKNYKNEYTFRYYVKNENTKKPFAKKGFIDGKRKFCKDMLHAVCMDTSLPINLKDPSPNSIRLFMAVPYDYMFKNALLMEEDPDGDYFKSLKSYTHIMPGCPFEEKLLKKVTYTADKTFINGVNLPFALDIMNKEKQEKVRATFEYYYPGMKNKKVIAILTAGRFDGEEETDPLIQTNIKGIMDSLDEEYFIITNNQGLMEAAAALNSRYCERFVFVNHLLQIQNILYFADVLITNNSRFAGTFSTQKKPIYCLSYKDNSFEKYMGKHYPGMCLKMLDGMQDCSERGLNAEQEKFCKEFSCESTENSTDKIGLIFEKIGRKTDRARM